MRESGIYDFKQKIALNPIRIGPYFNDKPIVEKQDFEDISIDQLKGILILYLTFTLFTPFVFIIELILI